MYKRDVPVINAHARATAKGFIDTALFAVLSIQQPFQSLPAAMRDVRKRGAASERLWGWKADSYAYLKEHGKALWHKVCDCATAEDAVAALVEVPGLGVVKAGFVAQMLGHDVACIDRVNAAMLGLPAHGIFRFHKDATEGTKRDKIFGYVQYTQRTGGAEYWWDTWCTAKAGTLWTPDEISHMHVTAIGA